MQSIWLSTVAGIVVRPVASVSVTVLCYLITATATYPATLCRLPWTGSTGSALDLHNVFTQWYSAGGRQACCWRSLYDSRLVYDNVISTQRQCNSLWYRILRHTTNTNAISPSRSSARGTSTYISPDSVIPDLIIYVVVLLNQTSPSVRPSCSFLHHFLAVFCLWLLASLRHWVYCAAGNASTHKHRSAFRVILIVVKTAQKSVSARRYASLLDVCCFTGRRRRL